MINIRGEGRYSPLYKVCPLIYPVIHMNSTIRNVAAYFSIVSLDVDSSDGRVLFLHNLHSWHEPGNENIVGHVLRT